MILPSGGDDTAAIQNAINAGGLVELSKGVFHVGQLNLTDRFGVTLRGESMMATVLLPNVANSVMIDRTGSWDIALEHFQLGAYGHSIVPKVGILDANSTANGGNASNVNHVDRIRTDGSFSVAASFVYGMSSASFMRSQFFNYAGMAHVVTANNIAGWGVSSSFATINSTDFAPSDLSYFQCEFHNMNQGWAIWMGAADSLRFYGGNVSSSAAMVSVNAAMVNGATVNSRDIIFDGTTFYSDGPPNSPVAISGQISAVSTRACHYTSDVFMQ